MLLIDYEKVYVRICIRPNVIHVHRKIQVEFVSKNQGVLA